ncbi:MAG: HDOD domain-containing protein [Nitrosomonadales bacterium]|nr:HDOD domain-containing protein [Nitrosomonadales bacterium]
MTTLISTLENGRDDFFALLLKRMSEQGDFPSLSRSVHTLAEEMHDENNSMADITGAILSDFSLTQKVIRLANSSMYAGMGGEITTVTRAAMVLGLDAVSHLALSVRFIDTLSASAPDSTVARTEMAKALLAGDIARSLVGKANLADGEEAVVCALMHHLGRLLLVFYFPDEWLRIQNISGGKPAAENHATLEVIGVTLDEISREIAKLWRLPRKISDTMISQATPSGSNIPGSQDWLKTMANFAGEAATAMLGGGKNIAQIASRYGDALLISTESIAESVHQAALAKNSSIPPECLNEPHGKPADSRERLAVGVYEATAALAQGMSFGNALNLVLETMYGSMGFNRVVAFLRDGISFKGRLGFGAMMPEALQYLTFSEADSANVFYLSLTNSADIFIEDVTSVKSASSIPPWLIATLPDVQAFVLLPMTFNGRPIGLLYGDWEKGTTEQIEPNELVLLRSLRDHLMKVLDTRKA